MLECTLQFSAYVHPNSQSCPSLSRTTTSEPIQSRIRQQMHGRMDLSMTSHRALPCARPGRSAFKLRQSTKGAARGIMQTAHALPCRRTLMCKGRQASQCRICARQECAAVSHRISHLSRDCCAHPRRGDARDAAQQHHAYRWAPAAVCMGRLLCKDCLLLLC